jgi:hypothetical protein
MTAQKLSSHEARDTSRLSPELLNKQQVGASGCTVTTELDPPKGGDVRKVVRNCREVSDESELSC